MFGGHVLAVHAVALQCGTPPHTISSQQPSLMMMRKKLVYPLSQSLDPVLLLLLSNDVSSLIACFLDTNLTLTYTPV